MARRERFDVAKSLLRSAATRLERAVTGRVPLVALKEAVEDILRQRTRLDEARLSRAVAHAPEVASASVHAAEGVLSLDASFRDGSHVQAIVRPTKLTFAPRGAKEVEFHIEAVTGAGTHLTDILAALGEELALAVWGLAGRRNAVAPAGPSTLRVDRDRHLVRLDLRGARAARQLKGTPLEPLLDLFEVRSLSIRDRYLELELGLLGRRS